MGSEDNPTPNLVLRRALQNANSKDATSSIPTVPSDPLPQLRLITHDSESPTAFRPLSAPPHPPPSDVRWISIQYMCAALHETKVGPSDYILCVLSGSEPSACRNNIGSYRFPETAFCKKYWHAVSGFTNKHKTDGYELCNAAVKQSYLIPKEHTFLRFEIWHQHYLRPKHKLGATTVPIEKLEKYWTAYGDLWTPQAGQLLKEFRDYELNVTLTDNRAVAVATRICHSQSELKAALEEPVNTCRARLSGVTSSTSHNIGTSPAVTPDKLREHALNSIFYFKSLKEEADHPRSSGGLSLARSPSDASLHSSCRSINSRDSNNSTGSRLSKRWWKRNRSKTKDKYLDTGPDNDTMSVHSGTGSVDSRATRTTFKSNHNTHLAPPTSASPLLVSPSRESFELPQSTTPPPPIVTNEPLTDAQLQKELYVDEEGDEEGGVGEETLQNLLLNADSTTPITPITPKNNNVVGNSPNSQTQQDNVIGNLASKDHPLTVNKNSYAWGSGRY